MLSTRELERLLIAAGKKVDFQVSIVTIEAGAEGLAVTGNVYWETYTKRQGTKFHRKEWQNFDDLSLILKRLAKGCGSR